MHFSLMTAVANKLLDDFNQLAPDEQLIVREHMVSLTEIRQREALNRLRVSSAGKSLLDKLLADRAGEINSDY